MACALYVFPLVITTVPFLLTCFITAIHGDKQQQERDWVLNEFKQGKSPIMVATDVASRGIGMNKLQPLFPSHPSPIVIPS
jgi:ATP-dependent RNA helicase DDX5/DBP2